MHTGNDDLLLLRALCQANDGGICRRACDILWNYPWADGEHRVIFEACARLLQLNARISPNLLASHLTRKGFPDVDLDALFEPLPLAAAELARRLDALEGQSR